MKITPFWFFLLILAVLIISMLFMKNRPMGESFINYNKDSPTNTVYAIPGYPNSDNLKIYDNVYYDKKNGSILVIEGTEYVAGAPNDPIIEKLDVIDRAGTLTTYPFVTTSVGENLPVSPIPTQPTSMPNGYKSVCITAKSKQTTNLQVLYVAWGLDTYIQVIDLIAKTNVVGYIINNGTTPLETLFNATLNSNLAVGAADTDANTGSYVKDTASSKVVYQLASNVFFEPLSGSLVIKNNNSKDVIYGADGATKTDFPHQTDTSSSFSRPWIVYDLVGQNMVVVVPGGGKTTVTLVQKTGDGQTFKVVGSTRFLQDGSIIKDGHTDMTIPDDTTRMKTVTLNLANGTNSAAVAANIGSPPAPVGSSFNMDDYLRKTQYIPPICPACPAVGVTCNTCGNTPSSSNGNSPSSSKSNGNSPSSSKSNGNSGSSSNGRNYGVASATADLGKGVLGTVNNVVNDAAMLGETALLGAGGLTYAAGSGATHLAENVLGGAEKLAYATGSGATHLVKDLVGGVGSLAKVGVQGGSQGGAQNGSQGGRQGGAQNGSQGGRQGGSQGGAQGGVAQLSGPQNPYTYNGTLSEKPGSNFIPVTADFSKFGR
jgi:hypothetical protein